MNNKTPHILLVEDNADDVELIRIGLSEQIIPYNLTVTSDGKDAIRILQDKSIPLPDLVLLDIYLPEIDGLEVLASIREEKRTSDLPVIIFTSSSEQQDLLKSYDLGANAYLRKGMEAEEFKATLKNLDIYWLIKPA